MLNQESISAVTASTFSKQFRKPLYNGYGFANLPQTILQSFGIDEPSKLPAIPAAALGDLAVTYNKVILLFVDAFGWRFFERYKDEYPILQRFLNEGVVSKLTSQFPSTTSAHVTTINTGMSVGEHGVYEWNYYEPTLDAVIQPLFFSYSGDKERETLQKVQAKPELLFPDDTIHKKLSKHRIASSVYYPEDFGESSYSRIVMDGCSLKPYKTVNDGLINLASEVLKADKGYFYFYYGDIDKMGHKFGPESPQFEEQVKLFLTALEQFLIEKIDEKSKDTLLLMTADHGQVAADPEQAIYVNLEFPELIPFLKTTNAAKPIIPAGSGRDFFLHVVEDKLDVVKGILTEKLHAKAEVYSTADLIAQGFFGPLPVSQVFLSRVGNLVILPYAGNLVWWFEEGIFKQKHFGHHGGATLEEMETILYAFGC